VLHVYALDINFRLTLTFRSYVNAFIVFAVVVSVVYDIHILLYTTINESYNRPIYIQIKHLNYIVDHTDQNCQED